MSEINSLLLLENISDPLFLVTRAGKIAFANKAGRDFAGPLLDEGKHPACALFCGRTAPGSDCGEDCLIFRAISRKKVIRSAGCSFFAANLAEGVRDVIATPLAEALPGGEAVLLQLRLHAPGCAEESATHEHDTVPRQEHEDLKRVLSQVKRAKDEWVMAMDVVSDLVLLLDQAGRLHRCNKAVSDLLRRPYAELIGQPWEELFQEGGLSHAERQGLGSFNEVLHAESGRVFQESCYLLEMSSGTAQRITSLHDISELRRTQEHIEKNRKRLESALAEISSMIQQVTEGRGGEFFFTLPPEHEACWQMMQCTEKDCSCYGREPLQCWNIEGNRCRMAKEGSQAHRHHNCLACEFYQEAADDPVARIGIQFSQMMRLINKKNQELQKAYEELKATQSQVVHQEKMASIGQLAAGVAHEINNPIGFVTSNLGTLQKYVAKLGEFLQVQVRLFPQDEDDERTAELTALRKQLKIEHVLEDLPDLIAESLDGVERVRKIVQNLKSFSRIDQSDYSLADINQCLDDTLNIIWNELKYKCTIKKDYGDMPRIKCYPQQLNQVFMNLLVNAAHAIKEKGEITITTRATDDEVTIAVSDTGAGIAPEHINRIFEPFFTTKEVGKGTGLGLSITYDIVTKKHGGRIEVSSEQGKGTTFLVTLPAITE